VKFHYFVEKLFLNGKDNSPGRCSVLAAAKMNLARDFARFSQLDTPVNFKLTHFFACKIEFDTRFCSFYEFDQWTVFLT